MKARLRPAAWESLCPLLTVIVRIIIIIIIISSIVTKVQAVIGTQSNLADFPAHRGGVWKAPSH